MSDLLRIDSLLREVQDLRDQIQVPDKDGELKRMEAEVSAARFRAAKAESERDAAISELEKLRASVGWTMERLRIRDVMLARGSIEIPCAAEGWLPFGNDPGDSERINWINRCGRAGIGAEHWLISIPHHLTCDEYLPDVYNIRDIIDLSRNPPCVPAETEKDGCE